MTLWQGGLFLVGIFCQVFLMGFQSRSVNSGKYLLAAFGSAAIGLANLVVIRTVALDNPMQVFLLTCIGGPAGICSAMFTHQRLFQKKV
jgi:hypothetical protein